MLTRQVSRVALVGITVLAAAQPEDNRPAGSRSKRSTTAGSSVPTSV